MIRIHYIIWAMMCLTSFTGGILITAQMDYIRTQAQADILMQLPLENLAFIKTE